MGKKIVILNGSPRKAGNTAALTAEFTKGAKKAGNTVTYGYPWLQGLLWGQKQQGMPLCPKR